MPAGVPGGIAGLVLEHHTLRTFLDRPRQSAVGPRRVTETLLAETTGALEV